jgi:hypothetical protein
MVEFIESKGSATVDIYVHLVGLEALGEIVVRSRRFSIAPLSPPAHLRLLRLRALVAHTQGGLTLSLEEGELDADFYLALCLEMMDCLTQSRVTTNRASLHQIQITRGQLNYENLSRNAIETFIAPRVLDMPNPYLRPAPFAPTITSQQT